MFTRPREEGLRRERELVVGLEDRLVEHVVVQAAEVDAGEDLRVVPTETAARISPSKNAVTRFKTRSAGELTGEVPAATHSAAFDQLIMWSGSTCRKKAIASIPTVTSAWRRSVPAVFCRCLQPLGVLHLRLHRGAEEVDLGRIALEDRSLGDAGALGDLGRRRGDAALEEDRPGGAEDLILGDD